MSDVRPAPAGRPLRVAVIGVGHLGRHHARLLAGTPGIDLVAVVDTAPGRAAEIASQHGGEAFEDWRDVRGRVDAVTIAVPTESHADIAVGCIEAGAAVLVEKPLASSVADATRIVDAAARHGVICAAGHSERFNPAVAAALPHVKDPRFIEVHRLGAFPDRGLDVDVIFDLMIHDLDLLLATVGSDVVDIEAVGVNVLTPKTDIANARLRFASGCIANLTASRISRDRVRKARFFQRASYVSIDFAAREVEVYRLVAGDGRPSIEGGRLTVAKDEPLRRELDDFVQAVREGRAPGVTAAAARDALILATRVAEAMSAGAGAGPS
ncbi:MAG TPA: Gfo/Idh/MocA family oxidoreductase [Vicinamibacterales bacterium]|nr:Gfo/Idh/MocA family oxidoreductase [Vicinamibacterales bacterium]